MGNGWQEEEEDEGRLVSLNAMPPCDGHGLLLMQIPPEAKKHLERDTDWILGAFGGPNYHHLTLDCTSSAISSSFNGCVCDVILP